jgi:hypothetical protein
MKPRGAPSREGAEELAIQALAFIGSDLERLDRFLSITGLSAGQIRAAANEPHFLAGVLDHMLGDESLLIAFAESAAIDPADIARARASLGGQWERDLP